MTTTGTTYDRTKAHRIGQEADYADRMGDYDEAIRLFTEAMRYDRPERAEKYERRIQEARDTKAWCERRRHQQMLWHNTGNKRYRII